MSPSDRRGGVAVLEISILVALCKYVNWTAEAKGYPGSLFIVIAVVSWFGCGIGGAMIGYESDGAEFGQFSVGAIVGYLVGVAVAGAANGMIVQMLPEQAARPNPAYDRLRQRDFEEQEYVAGRQRGERAEEDEVVPLTPAVRPVVARSVSGSASAAPTARRAWQRKW